MDRIIEFATNHWILCLSAVVIIYLLIQDIFESATRKYKTVSPVGVVDLMNSGTTVVVDVREPHVFIKSHVEDSLNIPVSKLDSRLGELEALRSGNTSFVVTCESGTHSPQACKKLVSSGFENVYLMQGGMQNWQDLNLPIRKTKPKHRK